MQIIHGRRRRLWPVWAILGLLGVILVEGCVPGYRVVRVYPEAEDHLQIAQKFLAEGNYSEAAVAYEWVAQNFPSHPFAQPASLWAQNLRQLSSLQQEILTITKRLDDSKKRQVDLKQKGSSLEEENQKLRAEVQRLKAEAQGLRAEAQGFKAEAQGFKAEAQGLQQEIQRLKESYIQLERLERELRQGR